MINKNIYLDNHSSTQIDKRVYKKMIAFLTNIFGWSFKPLFEKIGIGYSNAIDFALVRYVFLGVICFGALLYKNGLSYFKTISKETVNYGILVSVISVIAIVWSSDAICTLGCTSLKFIVY